MAKDSTKTKSPPSPVKPTCGIVMPIAAMGDSYSVEHWRRVRKILQRAIERAGLEPKLVWENSEVDVIQSAILQNLYENDVVVCDVSGLNPNVMLEAGLRLSTKRPTIIVTDRVIKPPFDISNIGYIDYQKDLEYNSIEDFIENLSAKIQSVHEAHVAGNYKSFVEQFKFETVSPETVSVPAEEFIKDQLSTLTAAVRRMERVQIRDVDQLGRRIVRSPIHENPRILRFEAALSLDGAAKVESQIDSLSGLDVCAVTETDEGKYRFTVPLPHDSPYTVREARRLVQEIIDKALDDDIPF